MAEEAAAYRYRLADLPVNVWFVGQKGVAAQRQGRYSSASVRGHPGKMRPELARRLIERYSRPGDWILDPMSGIGTTGVEAVHLGRHYVGLELEARFVAWQRQNLAQARTQGAVGHFAVYPGDARRLDACFSPAGGPSARTERHPEEGPGPVDTIFLSPPYGNRLRAAGRDHSSPYVRNFFRHNPWRTNFVPEGYGAGPENVGNRSGAAYFQAMQHVYAGGFQVLRPGGLLVVVLQPNRRGPWLDPLHHETARLCQGLGFELLDEIIAVLGRVAARPREPVRLTGHLSFWRRLVTARLLQAGWPVTLNQVEYVLVFRKPDPPLQPWPTPKAASRPPLPAQDRVVRSSYASVE